MKHTVRILALLLSLLLVGCSAAPGAQSQSPAPQNTAPQNTAPQNTAVSSGETPAPEERLIVLSDEGIQMPEGVHTANDIVYYEDRDAYDSGNPYGEGEGDERHSADEAAAHTVVHITQPGTYRITGKLSLGQIAVDLGEEAKRDPSAVVTLILDGMDITCTVAPAVIFYNVYECDTAWVAYDEGETEDYAAVSDPDTSAAGARVVLADGSVNLVTGSHVARIYKDKEGEKKLHKYDGAFYSKMSMNIEGDDGVLNITADNEGLNSELHLTLNGGCVNIQSQDDGINTNEDGVSVTTINGGSLHIVAGLGAEGDGVDSNGWLVINGGTVIAIAKPQADSGLDSDMGSYINGGWVLATGSTMDWAESDSDQVTMNLQFAAARGADEAIVVTDRQGKVVFAYDPDKDETTGSHNRAYQGAVLSCPTLAVGETYYVYVGGDVEGSEVNGLYDPDTVTGFAGGTRQQYTGTDVGMIFPGGMGGGFRPGGMEGQEPPEMPEGGWGEPPEGMEPGARPQGGMPDGEMPQGGMPDGDMPQGGMPGGEMPQGWQGGQRPNGQGQTQGGQLTASVEFYLSDKVNAFSGIADEENN